MKNGRGLALAGAIMILAAAGIAANGQEEKAGDGGTAEISFLSYEAGRIVRKDNPVVAVYEEKFNMHLNMELLDGDTYKQKVPIIIASGDLPDIMRLGDYEHFDYVGQDVFLDLTDRVGKYGNIMEKVVPKAWDLTAYRGRNYCIPSTNYTGKYITNMRKDWLDNLGMDVPGTLDEFYEALRAFTFDDPDGNGKDDTYGIGTEAAGRDFLNIYGAFGGATGYNVIRGNRIVTFDISGGYRDALRFLNRLYAEGILDPESLIHKQAQGREKLVQGRIGTFTSWWSIVPEVLMGNLKMGEITPEAEWAMVPPLTGPGGDSGMMQRNLVSNTVALSKKTKEEETIMAFLDYLISDEGAWLAILGKEGEHWRETEKGKVRTEEGQKGFDERWLDVLAQTLGRSDLIMPWNCEQSPYKGGYIANAQTWGTIPEAFEGIVTKELQQYKGEIRKYTDESFIRFVIGDLSLDDDWEEYVAQWKERGGEAVRQSLLAVYNENHGTSLVFQE